MKAEQNISSYKEAKQIDLVEYLSTLCFKPAKIRQTGRRLQRYSCRVKNSGQFV
jgi:hypothetical protein